MSLTPVQLVSLISLIDRSDADDVVRLVKRAIWIPRIVRPLAAALLTYAMLALFSGLGGKMLPVALMVGLTTFVVLVLAESAMATVERKSSTIATAFAVLGMFLGLAVALLAKKDVLTVIAVTAGAFGAVWVIVKVAIALLAFSVNVLAIVLSAFASPIAAPVMAIFARVHNRVMRNRYKTWVTSAGQALITFNACGIESLNHGNEAIFVASPQLRVGGNAAAAGIPLFTRNEIFDRRIVDQRLIAATQALERDDPNAASFAGAAHPLHQDINPATGLPMVGGIGGIDVGGSYYGFDSNTPGMNVFQPNAGFDGH